MSSNGFQQSAYNRYSSSSGLTNDIDIGNDVVKTGNIFLSDPKKHEDLKAMLESSKDGLKLEAMKRIINMVARGKDCGDLFPSVVKNVVSKNAEVKKLVYAYLTRYAEEQQELALLSISTFQRALKDPNQLIRGSALRVLSSIRVPMIVPIMMLAIKECVMDMSPYVRKIAANAIPKMYSLDTSSKDQLIEVIEKLLADKTTLVAGSAIQAFEEVCPERFDLIHKHYRKLCSLLIDVEEWGQIVIINMLTRYARTQFIDPNLIDILEEHKSFYSDEDDSSDDDTSSSSDDDDDDDNEGNKKKSKKSSSKKKNKKKDSQNESKRKSMDVDHRLLLNSVKPLLQSRNSAVVMSVVQLYYHCAPSVEMNVVIKALVRLLKSNKEVQYVVLNNIAAMSTDRPELLLNHLKSFFVYTKDSTQVKLLKLEILTNLANESNISIILRELQSYVGSTDQEFVKATIQSIGRCASNIAEVSDTCLAGLVQLISRKDENIVAEAVVVIRKLLQMQTSDHKDIIISLAILLDSINIAMAKASIIWLIGEYCDRVPKLGPDVLRKAAKTFINEKDIVKLQTLNLASKLYITNPKQTHLLVQYVLNLAKYDLNYDIRDRARFIRALLFPPVSNTSDQTSETGEQNTNFFLSKRIKKIFLATKPAPLLESNFKDRPQFQLSSMSQILNMKVPGYKDLPSWPVVAPDASARNVPEPEPYSSDQSSFLTGNGKSGGGLLAKESSDFSLNQKERGKKGQKDSFYSEDSDESSSDEDEESDEEEEEEEEEDGEESENENEESDEEESDDESEEEEAPTTILKKSEKLQPKVNTDKTKEGTMNNKSSVPPKKKDEESEEGDDDDSDDDSESEDEDDESSGSASSSSSSIEVPVKTKEVISPKKVAAPKPVTTKSKKSKKAPEVDLLLDFGDNNEQTPATGGSSVFKNIQILQPSSVLDQPNTQLTSQHSLDNATNKTGQTDNQLMYIPNDIESQSVEVIPKYSSNYVSARASFPRSLLDASRHLVAVSLDITNITTTDTIHGIQIQQASGASTRPSSTSSATETTGVTSTNSCVENYTQIDCILPLKTVTFNLGIDFRDSSQPFHLQLLFKTTNASLDTSPGGLEVDDNNRAVEEHHKIDMKIKAPIGELLQPISMTEKEFDSDQKKLRGMNEAQVSIPIKSSIDIRNIDFHKSLIKTVYTHTNITTVSTKSIDNDPHKSIFTMKFAAISISNKLPCLLELSIISSHSDDDDDQQDDNKVQIKVNSEQMTLINQVCKELENAFVSILTN